MMDKREQAKKILLNYFRLIARKAGANLDWDCEAEIESIVDLIIDAAQDATKK